MREYGRSIVDRLLLCVIALLGLAAVTSQFVIAVGPPPG
jgi:hypothetical protein